MNNFFKLFSDLIDLIFSKTNLKFLKKLQKLINAFPAEVIFVIEEINWVIENVGKNITKNLKNLGLTNAEITTPLFAKNKIIHFGSINCFIGPKGLVELRNKSNRIVVTWFHLAPSDKRLKLIPLLNKKIDILHTSNEIAKKKLVELGFDEKKIVLIPLGVDLTNFKKYSDFQKNRLKEKFKLPDNKIIIGSFQKDGVGWGEGLEPKLIKGPDIFFEVVNRINKDYDIHIFLTGPARGYLKKKLEDSKIPYTHIYFENHLDLVYCYNTLDFYIITSRSEGGPKALLECMANGVPIVTTNVGIAPEIIKNGINGFISNIDDIEQLYKNSVKLIENNQLREEFIKNGLKTIRMYNWKKIARKYYYKIYKELLNN